MSYSRWGTSYWYTFWCVAPYGQVETRDSASFEICTVGRFTASEIRRDVDQCVSKAVRQIPKPQRLPTKDDCRQLRALMLEFLSDVEKRYKETQT